jgi:hypothetical protein
VLPPLICCATARSAIVGPRERGHDLNGPFRDRFGKVRRAVVGESSERWAGAVAGKSECPSTSASRRGSRLPRHSHSRSGAPRVRSHRVSCLAVGTSVDDCHFMMRSSRQVRNGRHNGTSAGLMLKSWIEWRVAVRASVARPGGSRLSRFRLVVSVQKRQSGRVPHCAGQEAPQYRTESLRWVQWIDDRRSSRLNRSVTSVVRCSPRYRLPSSQGARAVVRG